MSWILFSILAAFIWAIVSIIDKYVLTKLVREPLVPVMILGAVGLIASGLVYFIVGFSMLSYSHLLLILISGIFAIMSTLFYFKAIKIEEVSRIIPLFYLTPFFVLILALIFLGEIFTPIKYFGIFLIMVGAILISSKKYTKVTLGKAFWLMILSSLFYSINLVITKYLLQFSDFWTIFGYTRVGIFVALVPIFFMNYHVVSTMKRNSKRIIGLISFNESLNVAAILCLTIAASVGFVTLVNTLSSLQPFFVLLFAVLLSIFYPKILQEEIGKSTMLLKFVAIILMFVGAMLIS